MALKGVPNVAHMHLPNCTAPCLYLNYQLPYPHRAIALFIRHGLTLPRGVIQFAIMSRPPSPSKVWPDNRTHSNPASSCNTAFTSSSNRDASTVSDPV